MKEISKYMEIEERLSILKILLDAGVLDGSNIHNEAQKEALAHLQRTACGTCVDSTAIVVEFMELQAFYSKGEADNG